MVRWQAIVSIKADSVCGNGEDEGERQARRLFLADLGTFAKPPPEIFANVCSRVPGIKLGTSLISKSSLPSLCLRMGFGTRLPVRISRLGSVLLSWGDLLHESEYLDTVRSQIIS